MSEAVNKLTQPVSMAPPSQWQEDTKKSYKKSQRHPVKVKLVEGDPDKRELAYSQDQAMARMFETTGFTDTDASFKLISQTVAAQPEKDELLNSNAAMAFLNGLAPENPLEGLLAAQMTAAHNLSMEFARRAMASDNAEQIDRNLSRASKMMKCFTAQAEALNKIRNKGQQRITVQHVQVNQGGQALIGDINPGGGGR